MAANILKIVFAKAKADLSANLARAIILCDTVADLPAVNAFTGYELIWGSTAHVIDDNQDYMMDSLGNWYPDGGTVWQNVYTKTETDTLLNAKQDTLTSAQLDAVNSGITAAKVAELYAGDFTTTNTDLLSYLDTSLIDTANSAFEIRRYGKMCFARVSLKTVTAALTGSDIISTSAIPSALRPEKSIYPPLVARNYPAWGPSTLTQAAISIETNGTVTLRTGAASANAAYVIGYFSYYAG